MASRGVKASEAAVGLRVHSGWALAVTVRHDGRGTEVLDRRRIDACVDGQLGGNQPYHFASTLEMAQAERFLAGYVRETSRGAAAGVDQLAREIDAGKNAVTACAILQGSDRKIGNLASILASHVLVHAAEGDLFRRIFATAFEQAGIPVTCSRRANWTSDPASRSATAARECGATSSSWPGAWALPGRRNTAQHRSPPRSPSILGKESIAQ